MVCIWRQSNGFCIDRLRLLKNVDDILCCSNDVYCPDYCLLIITSRQSQGVCARLINIVFLVMILTTNVGMLNANWCFTNQLYIWSLIRLIMLHLKQQYIHHLYVDRLFKELLELNLQNFLIIFKFFYACWSRLRKQMVFINKTSLRNAWPLSDSVKPKI